METNEVMAFELIQESEYLSDDFGKAFFDCEMTEKMLLRMAEWKDQQFKEYLEKNRTNYPDFMYGTDTYAFGMKEGYVKAFDKIINELFKEK